MLITVVVVAIILTLAGYNARGRLVAFCVTALCGVLMAFFLMPPRFSLRVSRKQDLAALAFYGSVGLVLTRSRSNKKKLSPGEAGPVCDAAISRSPETDLSSAVVDLMSGDLGVRLRAVNFEAAPGRFGVPCTRRETLQILSDVLLAALETPDVQRVSILQAQGPGTRRLIVVAHVIWPPPHFALITIGKRDQDCEPASFSGWPAHARANWFNSGSDRIYQISIEV